jgi:hypothetical protein
MAIGSVPSPALNPYLPTPAPLAPTKPGLALPNTNASAPTPAEETPSLHHTTKDTFAPQPVAPAPPVTPPEITKALGVLKGIQPLDGLSDYAASLGIDPIFNNGAEALKLIQDNNITVAFGDMGDTTAHAQWISDQNLIMINQKYQGNTSPSMIYALSEAIFHEAGHAARSGDNQSSIQEETNCLFLNAWANLFHQQQDPNYANTTQQSELLSNGVALYSQLFFKDPDPKKAALVRRIALKYGVLPMASPDHAVQQPKRVPHPQNPGWWLNLPGLADRVVHFVHNQQAAELFGPQ